MTIMSNSKYLHLNFKNIKLKWICKECVRARSSTELKNKMYSHTILTPKSKFSARSTNAITEQIHKTAQFSELYKWQRENLKGPEYILHDGPPYANGDLHMGHAVNKIIKDINNRSQVLQGNRVHYVPGWDCHGLPIELKALQRAKKNSQNVIGSNPLNVRSIARDFALETVNKQKEAFESWGVMADWNNQCYLTLNKSYVQNQLRQFYRMYDRGYIFRALKPVHWSPSSKTALAEAELEYDPQYKSTEVYVTFPLINTPEILYDTIKGGKISGIIWTTTPWTLVVNRAICYHPKLKYSVVTLSSKPGDLFLIGSGLIDGLENALGVDVSALIEFDGHHLEGTRYRNELVGETLPFLEGEHVTEGKGTGLVHTAPAHGPDDFLVALKNNMTVECNVDEAGRYINLGPDLDGLPVLTEGQEKVISRLGEAVLHRGHYIHSYPLDWRTKKPIIVRASRQWFIDTGRLKEKALAALDEVKILPSSSSAQSLQGFRAQLEKRPYWCISRQRAWGVPIPALYSRRDVIVHSSIIEKLCQLVEVNGPDAWWNCDVGELLTSDVIEEYQLGNEEVSKGNDIMDIWLDSGLSWSILDGRTANLYSEGVDQLTGWFQASLLTSIALNDAPPYRSIFVHGFVVDDKKRKMSKSIGNVIDPMSIIYGGKDKKNQPAYGVDTLRWWVASHSTQHSQIVISKKLLDDCHAEVLRLRNILKYLLGVIGDVKKLDFYRAPALNFLDSYLLTQTEEFHRQIYDHYNNFRYNNAAQAILFFVSNKVSGLYCHCVKDRLYCSGRKSEERLSAQLVIHTVLLALCKALGPILPHLVEEVWQHHPLHEKPFFCTIDKPFVTAGNIDASLMETVLDIKRDICAAARNESLKRFAVNVKVNSEGLYDRLRPLNVSDGVSDSVLSEVFEMTDVSLELSSGDREWDVVVSQSKNGQCLRCRKYNAVGNNDKCLRCESVLASL